MASRKAANGEGSVLKGADGRWCARFTYTDPETGKARRSASYGKTRGEAVAKMKERRARVEAGQPVKDATIALGVFAKQWTTTTLKVSDRKDSTKALYATLARVWLIDQPIGETSLNKLKPTDIEALILHMREHGKAASTIRQVYTVVRAILDTAVRDGYVARNVAAQVKRPGVSREDARFLNPAELRRLIGAMEGSRYAVLISFLAQTGLRRGEALALQWKDINLAAGTFRINGTLARVNGQLTITEPKTQKSRRVVRLSASTIALLEQQRSAQKDERERAGALWEERGLVFSTETGSPVDPRNALRALSTGAKRAGLSDVGLHTLRHSAASAMLGAGVPLKAVSDVLGHSSVAITGDVYGHLTPDIHETAMETLSSVLAG